jgi:uncharacterized protein YdeI (YjbR/CyaY-like superfamily)
LTETGIPTFFTTPDDFRAWLAQNHEAATELLVGFYKVGSGRPSITWPQAVDQALCYGWIDGVRKRIDDESYSIRFTPRKPDSIWSAANMRRFQELEAQGLARPAGRKAFAARADAKSAIYAYEQSEAAELDPESEKQFRANDQAWTFFQSQPPSYRRSAVYWVVSAKRAETRIRRLETLIADSAAGRTIARVTRPGDPR